MTKHASDAELMIAFAGGEIRAFEELVERYQGPLVNFFFAQSRDRQVSEDCAQEVFVKLYKYADRYEKQAKFSTFLFRVARNYWIDMYRSRKSRPNPVSMHTHIGGDADGELGDVIPGKGDAPSRKLEQQELRKAIDDAILALPEEHQMVVILSERQDLKYHEIAEILEIPVGTVKSRMHAAMRKLRDFLESRNVTPTEVKESP